MDVTAHRAKALLVPSTDSPFAGIIGVIQLFLVGSTPLAIVHQTAPQDSAIQEQEAQPTDTDNAWPPMLPPAQFA